MTPSTALVTMESEEGYNRFLAIRDGPLPEVKVWGQIPTIDEAPEPTDIIWENREYTPMQRTVRRFFVFIAIVILLLISV